MLRNYYYFSEILTSDNIIYPNGHVLSLTRAAVPIQSWPLLQGTRGIRSRLRSGRHIDQHSIWYVVFDRSGRACSAFRDCFINLGRIQRQLRVNTPFLAAVRSNILCSVAFLCYFCWASHVSATSTNSSESPPRFFLIVVFNSTLRGICGDDLPVWLVHSPVFWCLVCFEFLQPPSWQNCACLFYPSLANSELLAGCVACCCISHSLASGLCPSILSFYFSCTHSNSVLLRAKSKLNQRRPRQRQPNLPARAARRFVSHLLIFHWTLISLTRVEVEQG